MRAAIVVLLLGGFGLAGVQAPTGSLEILTLPVSNQAESCRIKRTHPPPRPPSTAGGPIALDGSAERSPVATSPWNGTDRGVFAWIWEQTADVRLPDAPPASRRDRNTIVRRAVDGVEEGYIATYEQTYEPDVRVYALKFAPSAIDAVDSYARGSRSAATRRFLNRPAVAVVTGTGSCAAAIVRHLESRGFVEVK